MLEIDVLLTEKKLAEDFLAGLERRYLAEKFFYWFPLSVKAWLDLCQGAQPYQNYTRSYQLVSKHAATLAERMPRDGLEVVGLAAGQGDKDLLVLEALGRSGRMPSYRPIDSSQGLLELAVARASDAGFPTRGLKADVEDPQTLAWASRQDGPPAQPRLYLLLGNSLGIIDPLKFLAWLRSALRPARAGRPQDLLVIDGELYSTETTLQGYDNPVNRKFAFAPLASLGLEEGRDGTLVFEDEKDRRLDGSHLVSKHFRAARRLKIPVAGQWVELQPGEKILMNASWKYSLEAFVKLIRETAEVRVLERFLSDDERFVMMLVGRQEA